MKVRSRVWLTNYIEADLSERRDIKYLLCFTAVHLILQ